MRLCTFVETDHTNVHIFAVQNPIAVRYCEENVPSCFDSI